MPQAIWTPLRFRMLSLALIGLAGLTLGADLAAAQGTPRGKFGDWEMRCETPAGANR